MVLCVKCGQIFTLYGVGEVVLLMIRNNYHVVLWCHGLASACFNLFVLEFINNNNNIFVLHSI